MKSLRSILLLFVAAALFAACGEKKQQAPNPANMPVPVNLFTVHPEKAEYYDKFPGTVVAMMQVDIRPEAEGYVTGIFFTEGTRVKKGQKLYTIDSRKYQASYNQSEANVRVAEANLDQAQKDADRYIFLNKHEAVAKQTLDHAMTTLQNAKQQVSAARQDLAKSQTDLGYSMIRAPFDGTIGISQVKLGNTVTTGQTIMNTISSDDPMAVDFVVNEKQIPRFLKLQQKSAPVHDSVFTLQMPDNSIYNYAGQIHVMDRGVNPQTGTIIIRLAFPNPTMNLRAGMSCNVRVKNDELSEQLIVPSKAIVEQMGEYFVYLAKDTIIATQGDKKEQQPQGPSLHALQRKVFLGQTIADQVIIRSGVQNGDQIVVDGVQKLHDGSVITLGGAAGKTSTGH